MSKSITLPAFGWTPRSYQMEAWQALRNPRYRTYTLAWHRRAGKDDIALHDTAIRVMSRVGNYWHALPEYSQARKAIWDAVNPHTGLVRWKGVFPSEIIRHADNQTMKITFVNGSTWQVVGSDNYDSLVGTTPVHVVFSESALADPAAYGFIRPALLENNGTSLHISSVRGRNHFYDLFHLTAEDDQGFAQLLSADSSGVFTPEQLEKERRYYVSQYGENIGMSMFRQEYLSDWDAGTIGAVWASELKALRESGRARPLLYDSRYPVMTFWDIGVSDLTVILFMQEVGNTLRLIDWYSGSDIGLDHYAQVIHEKPYVYLGHFAPHDIAVREWTSGVSRIEEARRFGIKFERVAKTAKGEQIAAASHLLRRMEIKVIQRENKMPEDDCEFILNTLGEYKFKFDRERRVMSKNPEHNWTSHYADALMVAAVALQQPHTSRARKVMMGNTIEKGMRLREAFARQLMKDRKRKGGAWG